MHHRISRLTIIGVRDVLRQDKQGNTQDSSRILGVSLCAGRPGRANLPNRGPAPFPLPNAPANQCTPGSALPAAYTCSPPEPRATSGTGTRSDGERPRPIHVERALPCAGRSATTSLSPSRKVTRGTATPHSGSVTAVCLPGCIGACHCQVPCLCLRESLELHLEERAADRGHYLHTVGNGKIVSQFVVGART